jgi:hypothetical protein
MIAAALLAAWGALENFQLESANTQRDPYMVNVQADRLARLLQAVPPTAVVGYISDLHDDSTAAQAMFNSARYTLAPRLLVAGTDRDFVLGNFTRPMDYAAFGRERNLQFVQDFGNGAVLYRKVVQ